MREISRRDLLSSAAALGMAGQAISVAAHADAPSSPPPTAPVWLDGAPPPHFIGSTFGVAWPRGSIRSGQGFRLTSSAGEIALQSWPIAFWPDGSVKWTAHAAPPDAAKAKAFDLSPGEPAKPADPIRVETKPDSFVVTTGPYRWIVMRKGASVLEGAFVDEKPILGTVRLIAQAQDRADLEDGDRVKAARYSGEIESAVLEQSGPVRAVVRLQGPHRGNGRAWLPFTLRLYFYAGSAAVRALHSFIFDGDATKDFISGIGLVADVPMRDAPYDRHVRFGGEDRGIWAEAVQTVTGLRRDPGKAYREAQVAGQALPPLSGMSAAVRDGLRWVPAWGEFSLSQTTSDGFTLRKRLVPDQAWITSASGSRASGLVYVGGPTGGVALAMSDFWQRSPTRLDVRGAATESAKLTAWLWSPDAVMDLRPYRAVDGMDTHAKENEGLAITYEDYEAGWGTATGIARTSELTLWTLPATPSNDVLADMAGAITKTPRLVITPARLHAAKVFGIWGLPDRSTAAKAEIEDRLTYLTDYYLKQIEQRRWYGFWDYGDIMHTYDADRHVWRYDVGGYAWDNSELSSDMLFWYVYLRSGRADVFRMAEAMTRHTGEVDVYHLGPYKGFGTRHGIQHFSDSSKQPRVSNAAYRRFYYYLTADERCGDLMHDLVHSDETLRTVDISRKLGAESEGKPSSSMPGYPNCGFGTSWGAFLAAWLTEWERTGNTAWRDRILNGMHSIAKLKRGWFAGEAPYDPSTGTFLGAGETVNVSHLSCVFGIFETQNELFELLDAPDYKKAWLDYCRYYNAPNPEIGAFLGEVPKGRGLRVAHSRLTALAATEAHDPALVKRAWHEFYAGEGGPDPLHSNLRHIAGPAVLRPIDEDPGISTNDAAQWGLAAIADLALIGSAL